MAAPLLLKGGRPRAPRRRAGRVRVAGRPVLTRRGPAERHVHGRGL